MKAQNAVWKPGGATYGTSTKYGIAVHCTSNTASAAGEASFQARRTDGTSAHFFLDEVQVIQCVDTVNRCGHAGSSNGNTYAVALEFCGVVTWTRAQWLANVNFDKAGKVVAEVCKAYSIPVKRVPVSTMKSAPKTKGFYTHNDMRLAWGGTTHTDPGPNFPMDVLFAAVNKYLNPTPTPVPPTTPEGSMLPENADLLNAKLGTSGPTVGVALQDTHAKVVGLEEKLNAILAKLNELTAPPS